MHAVELLVTELVHNAYDHGGSPRHVAVWRSTVLPFVRVDVSDTNRSGLPAVGTPLPDAERGRGLVLVNALASRWGVDPHPEGKTVWAEVGCHVLGTVPQQSTGGRST